MLKFNFTIKNLNIFIAIIVALLWLTACTTNVPKQEKKIASLAAPKGSSESILFSYADVTGIGYDSSYNRRDPSDIIKVNNKYYVWYSRMNSPTTSGYWATIWYATSEDEGHTWQEQGMALGLGEAGAFDNHAVFTPNILAYQGKYYLYYTGVKPTPSNLDKEFENNKDNDFTAIGVAVADSPDGPFNRISEQPIITVSEEPTAFDSYRVDDACLFVKDNKIRLYYKGRSIIDGKEGPKRTKMGLAIADHPAGPYLKHKSTLLDKSHEVQIWSEGDNLLSLASLSESINNSTDGIHFTPLYTNLKNIPMAPGLYRPHLENGNTAKGIPGWGIAMKSKRGDAHLLRFTMIEQ